MNISGNGRLVLAAYADGTLRWHAMKDGRELLAFYPIDPRPWPSPQRLGRLDPGRRLQPPPKAPRASSAGTSTMAGTKPPNSSPALRSDPTFRPQVISRVLHFRDVRRAQKFVDQQVQQAGRPAATNQQPQPSPPRPKEATRATSTCLTSASAPTAPNARALDLDYAHKDALDLGKALKSNAKSDLYWNVFDQPLTNAAPPAAISSAA